MASPVGQSLPVADSLERITGRVDYVLNVELPGMAAGRILRSPVPHARVVAVDASAARRLPGVLAVATGPELVRHGAIEPRYGRFFRDQTVLAVDRVRFAGEPVAAVAAVDEEVADEACRSIEVEYDPLPAVFDAEQALRPDAPLLHDPRPELRAAFGDMLATDSLPSNLCSFFRQRRGDVERGFDASDHVFEDTFSSPAVQHVALEPHVTVARLEGGRLTIWSSTQMPHAIRAQLAELFRLPLAQVRVITLTLGGGFGSKGSLRLEPIATLLAGMAGRPVKITLGRDEEFVTVTKHAATVRLRTGVTRDGLLLAREATALFNTGAYADVGPMVARNAGSAVTGPYRIPNVKVDSMAVWTNLVPAGAFRGFGVSQGAWAYESQADMIAERIGMDPVEFRRRNLLRSGDSYATGEVLHDLHYEELLGRVVAAIGWPPRDQPARQRPAGNGRRPAGADGSKRRGKAVTALIKATITPSTSTAAAKLNEDGSLNVLTSSVEMGQGARTALAQLAAEALDLPFERVLVSEPDTDVTPYDQQTSSSRTTFSMGNAVVRAVRDVRGQLLELAAEAMETAVEDLEPREGRVEVRGAPNQSMSYGDVVRSAQRGNLLGHGSFVTEGGLDPLTGQGVGSVHWHNGAFACEVEVDVQTGRVEVQKIACAVFAGRVVNPRLCELQIEGSNFFGLGQALFEEMVYDDGQIVNPNLADYMIPSFKDVPREIGISLLEHRGAGDIHGVGETSLPPVAPAVANAVYNAVGVRITDLPITPEKVLRGLEARHLVVAQASADIAPA